MRILVVQESDWLERGPHQSHHLMERLSARGHEVRVIDFEISWRGKNGSSILSPRTEFRDIRKATVNGSVTVTRPAIIRLPLLDYASITVTHSIEIRRQMRDFKPDVVVGFGILNSMIAEWLAARRGIPFLYYLIDELHLLVPNKHLRGLAKIVERHNIRHADVTLSINEALRQYAMELGASPVRTLVIRAGIDAERFNPTVDGRPTRERLGLSDDDVVLFFMGWLYEFSGLTEIASVLQRDTENYARFRLLVLGKGELWGRLREIAQRSADKKSVILVDWIPYEQVPKYIAAADICILPAQSNEVMRRIVPIKIYEYLALGKPVISTRLDGVVKEFGEESGVVYSDAPEGVPPIAKNLIDCGLASSEGMKGLEFVSGLDWNAITDKFEALLVHEIERRKEAPYPDSS